MENLCGIANYHRNFIQDFAELAAPTFYAITGKHLLHWDEEQHQAFDNIKRTLTSAPVLALPTKNDQFNTNASDQALVAVLSQVQNGQERVIAFASVLNSRTETVLYDEEGTTSSHKVYQTLQTLSFWSAFYSAYRS